ncbi:short-chain dehydrogenase/reductase [Spongiactinospora gelatinilytica]|uniref:Short-chain dehydrogenase/reductase n=1 Tax=Spongiactinospora gelatinilytica TaxID=2666298 RepID=A0A2W2GPW4_9ACTN|nr:oxidoreductase [Spongiactinospora gelatinilytica]PZG49793.1 short-chain dehydrogenase/reductase [Spongiactinospora gelatinilytica]
MAAKICLVTGASSGIGRATALELRRAGHVVYGAARRVQRMDDLRRAGGHAVAMDVTNEGDLDRVVRTILDEQRRIDVLINNAGIGLHGAIEDIPVDKARALFEVNLFGPARLTQLVLPHMRAQRSGTIVNVSSIAGEISLPLASWYHSSKHALEAYSDSLRQECLPFGIKVVVVQPGIIKTEFEDETPRELREVSGSGPYGRLAEAMASRAEGTHKASDPAVVAQTIRKVLGLRTPKPRYAVGYMAKTILTLNRLLSDRRFDAMVTKIG